MGKQRSILSELGSYLRGHRSGLARGESHRRRAGGAAVLFISFYSRHKMFHRKTHASTMHRYLCTCLNICACVWVPHTHICTHKSVNKRLVSLGHEQRVRHPFVIAGESYIGESSTSKTETKTERRREVTVHCAQHRGEISISKVN